MTVWGIKTGGGTTTAIGVGAAGSIVGDTTKGAGDAIGCPGKLLLGPLHKGPFSLDTPGKTKAENVLTQLLVATTF
jgi:hypothetical protein